jgi:hypothetical protein
MPSGKQLPFDTLKRHHHGGKTKAVIMQMWTIASVWGHYSNIPLVQPWDTLLVEKAPAWTPHLWPLTIVPRWLSNDHNVPHTFLDQSKVILNPTEKNWRGKKNGQVESGQWTKSKRKKGQNSSIQTRIARKKSPLMCRETCKPKV